MNDYIIKFCIIINQEHESIEYYVCKADNPTHAIEQTKDAYENASILDIFTPIEISLPSL